MKKATLFIALAFCLSSCTQRGCQRAEKGLQFSERSYEVTMFSGGDTVFHDKFTGIVNGEQGTDGFFYFKDGVLVEVSGDYVLTSTDK